MEEKIIFNKIINKGIFLDGFKDFKINNELLFSKAGICVVYGPNGTGKTSLINVLGKNSDTEYSLSYNEIEYSNEDEKQLFYTINDQNNRNIIEGETTDFLLGDNVRKEVALKKYLESEYQRIITKIINELKKPLGLSSASSKLLELVTNVETRKFVSDLVNVKSKGKNYNTDAFLTVITNISSTAVDDYEEEKLSFFIADYNDKKSIVQIILGLSNTELKINSKIHEIEENDEAIKILSKFITKTDCIVCDSKDIDSAKLMEIKRVNRDTIINSMDKKLKESIELAISISPENDPFKIKDTLINALDKGEFNNLLKLQEELKLYKKIYEQSLLKVLKESILDSEISSKNDEYKKLLADKPKIEDEDLLYIKEIISRSMDKELQIDRDENNNLKITLENRDFINVERYQLPLSAGEQNFLSLTFEFLKAKNSSSPIVVIDDPISSFDSIYKNKIVFSMVRMIDKKKRIILTHNLDLVRLLNAQYKDCFNLYILDNSSDFSASGFIPLNNEEKDLLIDLNKLLEMFRTNIFSHIKDTKAYLLSMIPFMRGYAHILGKKDEFKKLTNVMHGYKNEPVDIAEIYFMLFGDTGKATLQNSLIVKVDDLLNFNIDTVDILDDSLPLLSKTLKHTFTYLYLRLLVEKTLVEKYNVNTDRHCQLGDIIVASFKDEKNINDIKQRVFLTSKKTLINEFNHFEGNLSIFQPAIDITDSSLLHEKAEIINFVNKVKAKRT